MAWVTFIIYNLFLIIKKYDRLNRCSWEYQCDWQSILLKLFYYKVFKIKIKLNFG